MSLESNAKTAWQIKKEIECPTPESSSCIGCTFDCETKEKKQYISLEEVHKLKEDLDKERDTVSFWLDRIAEANKILEEFEAFDPSTAEWLERLKNTLNSGNEMKK
jgi:hypothetical protein